MSHEDLTQSVYNFHAQYTADIAHSSGLHYFLNCHADDLDGAERIVLGLQKMSRS